MFWAAKTEPEAGMPYDDPGCVSDQYRDASNLGARVALHARFSTKVTPGNGGSSTGSTCPAKPAYSRSAAAPATSGPRTSTACRRVGNRGRALSEMSRVLGPAGVLHASTNGRNHNRETGRMLRVLFPARPDDDYHQTRVGFSLENGEEQLSRSFGGVRLLRREDSLFVTEVRPLLDYLFSGTAAHAAGHDGDIAGLTGLLERELASRGGIRVTKDCGMFVARG